MCFSKILITHTISYMANIKSFKEIFESKTDYRKIVLLMSLIKNDVDLLNECGFLKNDINRLCLEFKKKLLEQNEMCLN